MSSEPCSMAPVAMRSPKRNRTSLMRAWSRRRTWRRPAASSRRSSRTAGARTARRPARRTARPSASPVYTGPELDVLRAHRDQLAQRVGLRRVDRRHPARVQHRERVHEPAGHRRPRERERHLGEPPVVRRQRRAEPPAGLQPRSGPARPSRDASSRSTRASSGSPGTSRAPARSPCPPRCRRIASSARRSMCTARRRSTPCIGSAPGSRSSAPESLHDCQSAQMMATAPGSSSARLDAVGQQRRDASRAPRGTRSSGRRRSSARAGPARSDDRPSRRPRDHEPLQLRHRGLS